MTKRYVIVAVAFANRVPCPIAGQYLEAFDFEAHNGRGFGQFTTDLAHAMKFSSHIEALEYWRTQSHTQPFRTDGKPNRPLTSTTVCIEPVDEGE